jgi:hypothetical protein
LIGLGVYFACGIAALVMLELLTKRISRRLRPASQETQDKLIVSGSPVGAKEATALTVGALWLFWPVAIFTALIGGNNGKKR